MTRPPKIPTPDAPVARTLVTRGAIKASMATDAKLAGKPVATPPAPARVAAFQTGLSAESRAAAWLIAKGYRILARRYRTPSGEIDIVARRRGLIAFIEVKARAQLDDAAYALTAHQRARIVAAAQIWLGAHPDFGAFEMRFDAILIAPKSLPRHLTAAFDASD